MTISLKHAFTSPVADENHPDEVGPDEWNAEHLLTQSAAGFLGSSSAGSVGLLSVAAAKVLLAITIADVSGLQTALDARALTATTFTAGAGLTGGGTLAADRTFAVGAGTGITVNADDVALDTSHVRNVDHTAVTLTAGTGLTGGGDISTNRTFALDTTHARNALHPASSTDNAIARYDSTAGALQNSGWLIDDSNNTTISGTNAGILGPGPTSPTAGSAMAYDWFWAGSSTDKTRLTNEAGIWAGKVWTGLGVSKSFDSSHDSASANLAPNAGLFVVASNAGTNNDVAAILGSSIARSNNTTVFGGNVIARTEAGLTGVKAVGFEIDVEPAAGVTLASGSIGLAINMFSSANPSAAIQTGGVSSGTWANGLVLGGLASTAAGVSPNGSAAMDSLFNSGAGTYTTAAGIISNAHKIRFSGTAAAHAFIYNGSSNNLTFVGGSGNTRFRNNADSASLITIADSGLVTVVGGSTDTASLVVRQTSGGSPTQSIFLVQNNGGTGTFFQVDATGNSIFRMATSSTALSVVYDVATAGQVIQYIFRDAGTDKWYLRKTSGNDLDLLNASAAQAALVTQTRSVVLGGGAVNTTATDGFLYVPTCAGTPTGTPTTQAGYAPIVVNTTNNKLYFYSGGAWRDAGP